MRQKLQRTAELLLSPAARVSGSFRQRQILRETGHRPWALPDATWFMGQVWTDLLFAHWRVREDRLRAVVPPRLELDRFDGSAWLGITPFQVSGLRLQGATPVPYVSRFPEINVRTYVTVDDRPGIYFLSLDADSAPAVFAARRSYRLPYFRSRGSLEGRNGSIHFSSTRISRDGPDAGFVAEYHPTGDRLPVVPESLERWLTERYCLYTLDARQQIQRADIHHPPWPLRRAEAAIHRNTMARPHNIELSGDPLLHFSARQDVALWPIAPVAAQPGPV